MVKIKKNVIFCSFFFLFALFFPCASADASTEFGIHFASQFYTPPVSVLQELHPQWLRYGPVVSTPFALKTFPSSIKTLVIFNNESVTVRAPLGSTDVTAWKNYVDQSYIPQLKQFLSSYHDITAMEIWNEEDLCNVPSCGGIPAAGYAYMLKNAAETIKTINPAIKVVIGGLASGQVQYVNDIKNADSSAFAQVDGVGIHPYGKSPGGWCVSGCSGSLPFGDLATAINDYRSAAGLPVWITEIGANVSDTAWQSDYLNRVFMVMQQTGVSVGIWYDMTDGGSSTDWGLLDSNDMIKPSGQMFQQFTPQLPPLIISPTTSPIPTTLSFSLFLHGLGKAGDNTKSDSAGNLAPLHQSRTLSVSVYDSNNLLVASTSAPLQYATESGNFLSTLSINDVTSGSYSLSIKVSGYLSKAIPGFFQFPLQSNLTIPAMYLVAGDVNNDNQLDILDYNSIISCFGSKALLPTCVNPISTDLNDDGTVSGGDYNLFLRELGVQKGQ